MKYFRYIGSIILGFLLTGILFIGLIQYQMGAPTNTSRWVYELDALKSEYARSIERPKLLLVSGSNTLYGISCQAIEQQLNFPCVNTALTQELGLDYILTHARRLAKPGDTILLPLEYQLYLANGTPSELSIDYVFAYDSDYLNSANLSTRIRYMGGIPFHRLISGIVTKLKNINPSDRSYQNRVNQNGDITDNDRITAAEERAINSFQPFTLNEYQLKQYARETIRQFIQWCDRHQVKAIATWPSTVGFPEYQQPEAQAFFQSIQNFYQTLNVPVWGTPEDFMYENSLFFNSQYHLNAEGREQRTSQIVEYFANN